MINSSDLTPVQRALVERPTYDKIFLEGAAGTGKTTAAIARLRALLDSGIPADQIALLVPQRSVALPYADALRQMTLPPGGQVRIHTVSGIAREMVALHWLQVAERAGFATAATPPTFLSLETAQYIMARVVTPLIEDEGYFETVTIPRGRLYSQLIDNLNKAAVVGFPFSEIAERLKPAWVGESISARMFDEVQEAANRFRAACLAYNLLDFSLLTETFLKYTLPLCADHLFARSRHLILDNVEEDTYAAHALFYEWLGRADSALVIFDTEAGYRRFLGADEDSASSLRAACTTQIEFTDSVVSSSDVGALTADLTRILGEYTEEVDGDSRAAFDYDAVRFYPEMLDWAVKRTADLIAEGVPKDEIVILAPFMSDALRFSLIERLDAAHISARSHRPSRALRDEPVIRALLTLAKLAHPEWQIAPDVRDIANALMMGLSSGESGALDLPRAFLLATHAYPSADSPARLAPFDSLPPELQSRITYTVGDKYEHLRTWLEATIADHPAAMPPPEADAKPKRGRRKAEAPPPPASPLDHFFSRLFGEVVSGRGFGLYHDLIAADAIAALVESARGFRKTLERLRAGAESDPNPQALPNIGLEYIRMVEAGVIANQYISTWLRPDTNAILVVPATTFLMNNRPASHQFWLDVSGRGWTERVYQPLTHPYVLSRSWQAGAQWTDEDEEAVRRDALFRLVIGLLRRCRVGIHLGITELGETGSGGQSLLIEAFNRLLRHQQDANPPT